MSENLQKMFIEDAPQDITETGNVKNLSDQVLSLQSLENEINSFKKFMVNILKKSIMR